jgi:signal peptidase I
MVGDQGGASGKSAAYVSVAWQWARSVVLAVVLFLVVRTFLVEAFKIPTSSMEGTLLVGDYLLVNKAVYGASVPFTDLRLPVWREPSRGEVVVFHPPHDPEKNYVKRVMGVPGDTLEMRDKTLFVNGREMEEDYVRHIDRGGDATHTNMRWQRNHLLAGSGDRERRSRSRYDRSESGEGASSYEGRRTRRGYRPSRDNWGPISVPEDSYFVLGDNRDNSEDSRYWGFVDRESIRGQPWRLYFSFDSSDRRTEDGLRAVRWERVGQPIR